MQAGRKERDVRVNMDNFLCLGDDINWPETTSRAVPETVIAKIANVDRTLFTKKEQLHLDLFLFSYYTGGMANVDVCNLTWDLVQEDRIVYERMSFSCCRQQMFLCSNLPNKDFTVNMITMIGEVVYKEGTIGDKHAYGV